MRRPVAKFECAACGYSDYGMSARPVGDLVIGECPKCGGDMTVTSRDELPPKLAKVESTVGEHFEILDFDMTEERTTFEVSAEDAKASFRKLLRGLEAHGYLPMMRRQDGELRIIAGRRPEVRKANISINILLLAATFATTLLAGYFLAESWTYAYMFSGSIMLMLGAHELGHKIAAWRNGVAATMPYFIPAPTILGTFGAFIRIKTPIPTKEALVEIGASGPILGFAVSFAIAIVGLMLPGPQVGIPLPLVPLAFSLLQFIMLGRIPSMLRLHPLAFAGWVGMFVTMLNLMPADQLDGGHVARGLLDRERHFWLTRLLGLSLVATGLFLPELPLWIWGLIILMFSGGRHVGALDDVSELSRRQKFLAAAVFAIFMFSLPVPL